MATFSEETLDLGVDLDPFAISPGLPVGICWEGVEFEVNPREVEDKELCPKKTIILAGVW